MNKKNEILEALLGLVFVVVFNVLFFVLGGVEHTASVWISYGFIHFAYLMTLLVPYMTRKGSTSTALFGMTIGSISLTYFFFEFVVGIVFILVKPESYKIALLLQVIIAGIYFVILISTLMANETTANNLEKQEIEVAFIKDSSTRVKLLLDKFDDKKTNKAIEHLYDVIRSSPTISSPAAKQYETDILAGICSLEKLIETGDKEATIKAAGEIVSLVELRNSQK